MPQFRLFSEESELFQPIVLYAPDTSTPPSLGLQTHLRKYHHHKCCSPISHVTSDDADEMGLRITSPPCTPSPYTLSSSALRPFGV